MRPTIYIQSGYAPMIYDVLDYLDTCAPDVGLFVSQNVREIKVLTPRMHMGEAYTGGIIGISELYFEYPETYELPGRWNATVSAIIAHEARHSWQYSHGGIDELDASLFTDQVLARCP